MKPHNSNTTREQEEYSDRLEISMIFGGGHFLKRLYNRLFVDGKER